MSKNVRTQLGKVVGKSLNGYHARVKPKIDELKFKEQYQGRIIDCMVGEVDDNYIETPETDSAIVKLEHSKEGLVKVPSIKGKTILVDADGNETDTPAEGCRLVSVGEEEDNKLIILSKNNNLFNFNSIVINKGSYALPLKSLEIGKTYSVKTNEVVWFKISKALDSGSYSYQSTNKSEFTFTMRSTMKEENLFINNRDVTTITDIEVLKGLQPHLQLGNSIASYVEPKQHKTEILLDEPLRSVPNGVCDEIVANQLKRKIIKIVLDGSEDWRGADNGLEKTYRASFNASSLGIKYTSLSTFFEPLISGTSSKDTENIQHSSLYIYVRINRDRLSEQSPQGVKEWLSKNNVTVLCELEEPIIEELPNGITLQGFDDTTMYIENSITPMVQYGYNALIPYKEELSKQKEEVETNTLDIENNIIPYLMDMEFNLMLMEDK